MKALFVCEWRRFAPWTLVFAISHLVGMFLLSRVTNPLQWRAEDQAALLFLFMLYGFVLAVVQIGAYRKPSPWLWLIHRPLSLRHIFLALSGSALAILAAALFSPLLSWLLATDLLTTKVVDWRDYLSVLHLLAFGLMAWLIGALTMLSRRKLALAALAVPLVFAVQMISVWWLILPVVVCLAWLFYIALHAFRANRDAPIERARVLLLTALPMQLGLFLLVFHLGKGLIETASYLRRPPLQSDIQRSARYLDGHPEATEGEVPDPVRKVGLGLLDQGLAASSDPHAASWREQLPLLPLASLSPSLERLPVRHQFGNTTPPRWDEKRGTEWTFSHDRMRYEGRDPRSGTSRGSWGRTGVPADGAEVEPFDQVPLGTQTRNRLYAIDAERQLQHEILRLPDGEWFVAEPAEALDRLLILSNRRLRVYRRTASELPLSTPPALDWELDLPEGAARLAAIDMAELLDGWLVSFFHCDAYDRVYEPWQQVVHVDTNGQAQVVAERHGVDGLRIVTGAGGSPLLPTESWWLSPALHTLATAATSAFDKGLTLQPEPDPLPDSPALYAAALALMLAAPMLAYLWLRRSTVSPARRRLWFATCAVIGFPALLSLIFLEPRGERYSDVR